MKPVYKIMFFVSLALAAVSLAAIFAWGIKLGVDFRGGSVMDLQFETRPPVVDIRTTLTNLKFEAFNDLSVNPAGTNGVVIKSGPLTEEEHQEALRILREGYPSAKLTEFSFDSVGPAIGSELTSASQTAIILALLAISAYIALVFRAMRRTLSPWAMSLATMIALAHDILIPLGVFAFLTHYQGVEISAVFVAAILTVIGYSISDTVVVFDRVRENIIRGHLSKDTTFSQVVHESIMQTLVRSINTNITTLLSLVAIYFFGGQSIRYFALALIIGIFSGAYSSIFVASPVLVWMSRIGGSKGR